MKTKKYILAFVLGILVIVLMGTVRDGQFDNVVIFNDKGTLKTPQFDDITNALEVISVTRTKIHEGKMFIAETIDTSMANNDTTTLAFKTPDTLTRIHLIMFFSSKGAAHLEMIEGSSWDTSSGSQSPVYNRERNSTDSSAVMEDTGGTFVVSNNVILNPSGLTGGTVIHDFYTWSDKKQTTKSRDEDEFVLKQDETYAFRLTADEATNAGHIILRWYEQN